MGVPSLRTIALEWARRQWSEAVLDRYGLRPTDIYARYLRNAPPEWPRCPVCGATTAELRIERCRGVCGWERGTK